MESISTLNYEIDRIMSVVIFNKDNALKISWYQNIARKLNVSTEKNYNYLGI